MRQPYGDSVLVKRLHVGRRMSHVLAINRQGRVKALVPAMEMDATGAIFLIEANDLCCKPEDTHISTEIEGEKERTEACSICLTLSACLSRSVSVPLSLSQSQSLVTDQLFDDLSSAKTGAPL